MLLTVGLVLLACVATLLLMVNRKSEQKSLVDNCVVGTWGVTSMTIDVTTTAFGEVHFTSVAAMGSVTYAADGTAVNDYGNSAQLAADVTVAAVPRKALLKITGTARYTYRTANDVITFSGLRSTRTTTLTIGGTPTPTDMDLDVTSRPARYSCVTDILTIFTETYRAEAHRAS